MADLDANLQQISNELQDINENARKFCASVEKEMLDEFE
jgi:hypothetical protein